MSLAKQLLPVGDFIKDALAALDVTEQFIDSQHLLLELSQKIADKAASENKPLSATAQFLAHILAIDDQKIGVARAE